MGESNFSLSELKGLTEPVNKLIETVSGAVGIVYEPTRIRRKAKAEADAAVIAANAQVQVAEIQRRADKRLRDQELRRQKNIEAITRQAIKVLPETVSSEEVDEDWVAQFFDHCQDVKNEQMQSL